MAYTVEYFKQRILEEIESWPVGVLAAYARLVELLMEFGPVLGMPHCRTLGGGLFELRPRGRDGIGRVLYCFVEGRGVMVLHVFIKKTQTAPRADLKIARRRMREVRSGQE